MLDAIRAIEVFVEGLDFDAFRNDRKTVDAVVRNLEVIGEAARYVPETVREEFEDIPWRSIIGIRSVLIHEYFTEGTQMKTKFTYLIWELVADVGVQGMR